MSESSEGFPRNAFAVQHTSLEGKISWLDGDPSPHWREDLMPSCLTWDRGILVGTILSIPGLPGWTKIVEFQVTTKKDQV